MKAIEQKFHDEIEVERLWVMTEQGEYVVFTILPISMLLVFGLWDTVAHTLLILWFLLQTATNFFRWRVLRYYQTHKDALIADTWKFKRLMLLGSILTGLCWGVGIVCFLNPSDPINVLVICIPLFVQVVGAMFTWFCYLPAVIAIALPPMLILIVQLLLQGGKIYIAIAFIFSLMTHMILTTSVKLLKMLNHALRLNFENAALRQESEDKSILLETVLENMDQGISLSDKDDQLHMWNKQFVNLSWRGRLTGCTQC